MRLRILGLIATAVAMTASSPVLAQPLQYQFFDSTNNPQTNFVIPAIGQTVEVRVFLTDTGAASSWFTGPHPSNNGVTQLNPNQTQNLNTYGLRTTGFQINNNAPGIARVQMNSQATSNPSMNIYNPNAPQNGQFAFLDPSGSNIQATASILGTPGGVGTTNGQVFVGSFIFTGLAGGVSSLSFADNSGQLQQNVLATEPPFNPPFPALWNGGAVLDAVTVSPNTTIPGLFAGPVATITVVPEPTSFILGGLGLAGYGLIRRYRRK
jgi:hypothetical protein